jgi:hypothetical protein
MPTLAGVLALLVRVQQLDEEAVRLRVLDQAGTTLLVVRGSGVVIANNGADQ